jgi:hypothetical protein
MNPGGITNSAHHKQHRLDMLKKSMLDMLASRLTPFPYDKDAKKMESYIEKRAQKKTMYAEPIMNMTPKDIAHATSLYRVKIHLVGTSKTGTSRNWEGVEINTYHDKVYYLKPYTPIPGFIYRLDVANDVNFNHPGTTPSADLLLKKIVKHAIDTEGNLTTIYYVMNAKNENEAAEYIIAQYEKNPKYFGSAVAVEIIRRNFQGGKTKRRQTKKRQIKKRQTKKRQTISKKWI